MELANTKPDYKRLRSGYFIIIYLPFLKGS